MLRSQAPSVQRRLKELAKGNTDFKEETKLLTGRVTKRVRYTDQDGTDDDDDDSRTASRGSKVPLDESAIALKNAIKIHLKLINESKDKHEAFIKSALKKPFKIPMVGYDGHSPAFLSIRHNRVRAPLHDPLDPEALVVYHPPEYTRQEILHNKDNLLVHVVVDPCLCRVLRPHQREGVSFMYRCVTGAQIENFYGCIMADDMGLGKTLQCITLLWTLLRQGPDCKPIIDNCIIVCPSSLVTNWFNEIKKWLGIRLSALAIGGDGKSGKEETIKKLEVFQRQKVNGIRRAVNPVLIISYQTLRNHVATLQGCEFGLMICDEGHTLKNENALTYNAIQTLQCKRRIIISGTPVQNDLLEYYSLVNFVNPNLLGTTSEFRRRYENPILASRDADATPEQHQRGQERLKEMLDIVYKCMIRRTSLLLSKYLPLKYEMVVCCPLSPIQKSIYEYFIQSKNVQNTLRKAEGAGGKKGSGTSTLNAILFLKNLCSHPKLAYDASIGKTNENGTSGDDAAFEGISEVFPEELSRSGRSYIFNPELSSKMKLLDSMLALIKSTTDDKIVLVSNYTSTLDLFIKLCSLRNYKWIRLDGSVTIKKRGELVKRFNDPESDDFIFMLSSKAGGCGLNLIGANRLIMFDPDWNPANDGQAMARVWRDGQKKTCYLYRFMCTGTIEEKIFQRQSHKKALSNCVVDKQEDVERHFSVADLKELFCLEDESIKSDTHRKFSCERCQNNRQVLPPPNEADCTSDLKDWHHCYEPSRLPDDALKKAWEHANLSFVFYQKQDKPKDIPKPVENELSLLVPSKIEKRPQKDDPYEPEEDEDEEELVITTKTEKIKDKLTTPSKPEKKKGKLTTLPKPEKKKEKLPTPPKPEKKKENLLTPSKPQESSKQEKVIENPSKPQKTEKSSKPEKQEKTEKPKKEKLKKSPQKNKNGLAKENVEEVVEDVDDDISIDVVGDSDLCTPDRTQSLTISENDYYDDDDDVDDILRPLSRATTTQSSGSSVQEIEIVPVDD